MFGGFGRSFDATQTPEEANSAVILVVGRGSSWVSRVQRPIPSACDIAISSLKKNGSRAARSGQRLPVLAERVRR